jgi:hypothetical protein
MMKITTMFAWLGRWWTKTFPPDTRYVVKEWKIDEFVEPKEIENFLNELGDSWTILSISDGDGSLLVTRYRYKIMEE